MRGPVVYLLLLEILFIFSTGQAQFYYGHFTPYHYQQPAYFRNNLPFQDGSLAMKPEPEGRLFFSALTLTLSTTTVTRTVTSSTVCTTTTAALVACVVAGRRKRQELFYNEDPLADDETSVFLPLSEKQLERLMPTVEEDPVHQVNKNLPQYTLALEPGFNPVSRNGGARFLLSVDTSTIFTTTTSLLTVSLTAICSSTTSFSACVSSG